MKKALSLLFVGLLSASSFADFPGRDFPGRDYPGRDHGRRGFMCTARSGGMRGMGREFVGYGRSRQDAASNALRQCNYQSGGMYQRCMLQGCRPVR